MKVNQSMMITAGLTIVTFAALMRVRSTRDLILG